MAITKSRDPKVWEKTKYFPISKNWKKLKPIFESEEAKKIWYPCMEEYWEVESENRGLEYKPEPDAEYPSRWDSCDWRFDRPNSRPFWEYACHAACHWVADLALFVAMKAYPKVPWRILYCQKHTTIWNGCTENPVLFDINFLAMGVKPEEAMRIASRGREFKPGRYLKAEVHLN